jgi:hypothetical protein
MPDGDPQRVLRSLEAGELTGAEAREAGRVALEALRCIDDGRTAAVNADCRRA